MQEHKNILKVFLPVIIITGIAAMLPACATPALPLPVPGSDTLLLVYTTTQMSGPTFFFTCFEMKIEGIEKPVNIDPRQKITFVRGLPEGMQKTSTLTLLPIKNSDWDSSLEHGAPKPQAFPVEFQMSKSTITILPVKFIYMVEGTVNDLRSGWKLDQLTQNDIDSIKKYVSSMKNAEQWTLNSPK